MKTWNKRRESVAGLTDRRDPASKPKEPRHDPLVEPRLKLVGTALAPIRDPLALVGGAVAFVGHPVSFVRATLPLIKLAAPLLQPGGLRTGALSSVTILVDDSTRPGCLIASSELLAPVSALLSQTGPALEHFGRAHENFEQTA